MRILVTGGAGYIGSHTVTELVELGHEIIIVDDLSTGFESSIHVKATFYKGSLLDLNFLKNIFEKENIEAIVHFAAKLIVPESVEKPLMYYENNLLGAINLLKCCNAYNIKKFIFSSTAAVYGNPTESVIKESTITTPINPYGQSKLMVEKILADYEQSTPNFKFVVLRYFNVAGAALDGKNGQKTKNATHLIKVAAETAVGKRESMSIFGTDYPTHDGTCVRDYIHVVDLAKAHCEALQYLKHSNQSNTFNCGYGVGFSVKEVISVMREVSGNNFTSICSPRRKGDPAALVANNENIIKNTNWRPTLNNIKLITQSAFNWEKKSN